MDSSDPSVVFFYIIVKRLSHFWKNLRLKLKENILLYQFSDMDKNKSRKEKV